jgi:hypothetical protein
MLATALALFFYLLPQQTQGSRSITFSPASAPSAPTVNRRNVHQMDSYQAVAAYRDALKREQAACREVANEAMRAIEKGGVVMVNGEPKAANINQLNSVMRQNLIRADELMPDIMAANSRLQELEEVARYRGQDSLQKVIQNMVDGINR